MQPHSPDEGEDFSASVTAISTAFGDPTRRAIYLWLKKLPAGPDEPGATATEVAREFGLHANVARHHLEKLAAGGYVEVIKSKRAGGAGRPSKRFISTQLETRMAFDPSGRMDDLLVTLLGRVLGMLPPAQAELVAEEVGEQYGKLLAQQMEPGDGAKSVRSALHSVAGALTAHGFAAHTEKRGSSIAIIAANCPFGEAATQHPVICAVDRGMVRGMLAHLYGDTATSLTARRPDGDNECVTVIS